MSRCCVLIHAWSPSPGGPEEPLALHARALAAALRGAGSEVVVLETGRGPGAASEAGREAAREIGARYVHLDETADPFGRPILPAVPAHRTGLRVAAAIASLGADELWAIGHPAHAAAAAAARACGLPSAPARIHVVLDDLAGFRRDRLSQFPNGGRDDLATDFLDRRALAFADDVTCPGGDLLAWLEASGPSLGAKASVRPLGTVEFAAPADPSRPPPRGGADGLPTVSVCMPYHDQPAFLGAALEAIAAQSLPPAEVIVVDDGSKSQAGIDAFAAAAARFARPGWRFIRQANAGPAAARNRAAREAGGGALLFCDADNRSRPDMVAALSRALAASGADCVSCAFEAFRGGGDANAQDAGYVFAPLGPCLELGLIENVLGDVNFIVRREVFEGGGGFPADNREASEDWQFLLQLLAGGGSLETVPAVLFDYRLGEASHARRHGEFASAGAALQGARARVPESAWRALWPYLAGAIRDPRLPRAQAELEAAKSELGHVRGKLAEAVDARDADRASHAREAEQWRRRDRIRRASIFLLENTKDALDHLLRRAREEAAAQHRADADVIDQLSRRVAALEESLTRSGDKIRRMQESFSWRSTAPLRAARRALLDRKPPPAKAPPPAPSAARAGAAFRHHIDAPRSWGAREGPATIRGWCFSEEDASTGVRARIGERIYGGTYGLDRPDLLREFGRCPQCAASGFKIEASFMPSDAAVALEVRGSDGVWKAFLEAPLRADAAAARGSYEHWLRTHEEPGEAALAALRKAAEAMPSPPLLSVLMPVFDPPARWLERAIGSVRAQAYPKWELCIADDASTMPHVREILERHAREEPRIKVARRERNGHICAATNSALAIATGSHAAFMDHDDELAPHALYCIAAEIASHPGVEIVYTDEDKIDEEGARFDPHFKPDWNPDLLLGQNYISHLAVVRTDTLRAVGGLREGFEGAQDWDLLLRVSERAAPGAIRHVPRVLYHWRAGDGSTALHLGEKSYAAEAARRALAGAFERRGIAAELRPVAGGHWRAAYPLPERRPLVSIIVPTHDAASLVRVCTASLFARTAYEPYEVILVDNRSTDPAALELFAELARDDGVRVLAYDAPFNFSAINNFAARQARGEILCLLNNDIEILETSWLDELVSQALRPGIGAVGARLYYPDMRLQHAGVITGLGGVAGHAFKYFHADDPGTPQFRPHLVQNLSVVTAACLAIRRDLYFDAGGFDEQNLPVAFNDVDFCLKVEALGYRNLYTPFAKLLHHESASRGAENTPEKIGRFQSEISAVQKRWGERLLNDPAYNPNLSLDSEDFALAYPPRTPPLEAPAPDAPS